MLRNSEDAEEAVQEALIRGWRRRDHCRTQEAHVAWLLQITRNESLRVMERRRLRMSRELGEPDMNDAVAEEPRSDELLWRLTLEQAISELGPGERTLIALRYGADLTQPELARRLDLPEGTVKVRLHRIRGRLRTIMEEDA